MSIQSEPETTTMPVHGRCSFENIYAGEPRWEIPHPRIAVRRRPEYRKFSSTSRRLGLGQFVHDRMGGMAPEMRQAISQGVEMCGRQMLTLEAYVAHLQAAGGWTDKELREIQIAIRWIVDPPRYPRQYQASDN